MRNPLSPVSESVHDFINCFMSAYGETKDKILEELYPGLLKDTVDAIAEVGGDIAAGVSLVRKLYEIISIPDKLFMKKVERYLNGIAQIPIENVKSILKKPPEKCGKRRQCLRSAFWSTAKRLQRSTSL